MVRLAAESDPARLGQRLDRHDPAHPEWPDRLAPPRHLIRASPQRLIVEITESSMIEDFETTRALITACKTLGVKLAMDDFGAGHTSFRNLRDLAFDMVKIDGAFVQNIVNSADDRFFVRTLIDLAHHLGLEVVAEWVEDEATARSCANGASTISRARSSARGRVAHAATSRSARLAGSLM